MKKLLLRIVLFLLLVLGIGALGLWLALPRLNDYQTDGELRLAGLSAPVEVSRDEKGMPYLRAESLEDALFAQGFVTAQDRLFNMQLIRWLAQGRLSELAGEAARSVDIRHRTLGIYRAAQGHTRALDPATRALVQRYADGVNAFIESTPEDLHLEFRLAGITPEPWTVEDSLSVLYLMAWNNAANVGHEIVYSQLAATVGPERAQTLDPLNINPDDLPSDDPPPDEPLSGEEPAPENHLSARIDWRNPTLLALLDRRELQIGSNNWAAKPALTAGGQALLAGDPHLDARMLPGVWYPSGLIWPGHRAVGVSVPGLPGFTLGRTEFIAASVTNAYGDAQDLFIETLDPEDPSRYLEGEASVPFEILRETLRIKDESAAGGFREEPLEIRLTRRGPVVSGLLPDLDSPGPEKVVTLRWAAADPRTWTSKLGSFDLLTARNVAEVNRAMDNMPMISLNWVFADHEGGIGWRVSGRVPVRLPGCGERPWVVADGTDPWIGWIPDSEMPQDLVGAKGWLGTANHLTIPRDYPYYYSNRLASSYRYARLKELFAQSTGKPLTPEDFWRWQRDVHNPMARALAPILSEALSSDASTQSLGDVLAAWDFQDEASSAGALIFQATLRQLALATFSDELGEDVTKTMLSRIYYWQERFGRLLSVRDSASDSWFDDVDTEGRETREQMIVLAGQRVLERFGPLYGNDPAEWQWGQEHYLELYHPLRREGFGSRLLGSGPMPVGGSPETLYRGFYSYVTPYAATATASLRLVVDFADPDKMQAVLPGGVAGRAFHPHQQDQVSAFMSGEPLWWWFSDPAIESHTSSRLRLVP